MKSKVRITTETFIWKNEDENGSPITRTAKSTEKMAPPLN